LKFKDVLTGEDYPDTLEDLRFIVKTHLKIMQDIFSDIQKMPVTGDRMLMEKLIYESRNKYFTSHTMFKNLPENVVGITGNNAIKYAAKILHITPAKLISLIPESAGFEEITMDQITLLLVLHNQREMFEILRRFGIDVESYYE